HVLAITFTNKAADEMRRRIEALDADRGMWVCTFHSLGARLLRIHGQHVGLKPGFSIFDQSDRMAAIKSAMDDCGLISERWRPRTIDALISQAKSKMTSAQAYAEEANDYVSHAVARIYTHYQQTLAQQNAVDFDDLLTLTARLLQDVPEVRERLEQQFQYVLMDESQDINHAQYLMAHGLCETRRNVCATGDPDQSIYGWRGANIENILEFERDFPDAMVVRLEQNFRSTQRILSAAGRVIVRNTRRKKKELWTRNEAGPPVQLWTCEDERDEANRIAADVVASCQNGCNPGEIAVFYRVTALTRVLEDAMRRAGLPYQVARGTEFYGRKEIKDVLAYVRLLVNPADEVACARAMTVPSRGIGRTTLQRLVEAARATGRPIREVVASAGEIESLKSARTRVRGFADLLVELSMLPTVPVRRLLEELVTRTGLERILKDDADPEKQALTNVNELISSAAEYDASHPEGSLEEWLTQVSLVNDVDRVDLHGGAVTLMTLHAAKGLEFPVVYIAGVEDGLLPHQRANERGPDDVEEERRLFFVGMTRAIKRLTLTRAEYRMQRGFSQRTMKSPFLDELPRDEVESHDFTGGRHGARYFEDDAVMPDERLLVPGQLVRHAEYGVGRIRRTETAHGRPWVSVHFAAYGEKTFALQYAELEVVET
ncbi:MAG: 3'-5' exonuclease, partial [Phycisphaerae bacterium]